MNGLHWNDRTPSRRCDWIDLIRGWAVIVMIEVHCVNVWLHRGLIPDWLMFVNGLVAPSFILCSGYSLALSTFRPDGSIRPFGPTFRRLGFILLCAYLLHAPGFGLSDWTVRGTLQKYREFAKIDVLQCIVFSLLVLHGLARLLRRPLVYAGAALVLAVAAALVSPALWRPGVGDGLWLPVRGLLNGNTDRGVTALFPLFPWFAFAAFGSVLGAGYRHLRVLAADGRARWSEAQWLLLLAGVGAVLCLWGTWQGSSWLAGRGWSPQDLDRLHNTTLPSVLQRFGVVCLAGALLGGLEAVRGIWPGPAVIKAASFESLLVYMLHLEVLFGVLLARPVRHLGGWDWYSLGWGGTLGFTALLVGLCLGAAVAWQKIRRNAPLAVKLQRMGVALLVVWFLGGCWIGYWLFQRGTEVAGIPAGRPWESVAGPAPAKIDS